MGPRPEGRTVGPTRTPLVPSFDCGVVLSAADSASWPASRVAKALESEESSTVMQKNLATRFRLITPLLSSAFAFVVIFGWRW